MKIVNSIRNNIPNAITCCNLLSGALACIAAFHAFEPWWWGRQGYEVAFVLIAAAAVFDFFDGFAARLLHAVSPLGKELDSLSDAVSFGLAPAMVLYNMLVAKAPHAEWLAYMAMLIPAFGALRLAKFNVSTNQTTTFTGLPIPANAIFWIGFTNFYVEHHSDMPLWVVAVAVVALSLLMVCGLRMFSLKLHNLSLKENYKQYLLVVAFVAFVALCGISGLAWAMLFYIALSAVTK